MLKSFLDAGTGYLKNLTKSCPWQPSCLNLNLWKPSFFFQTLNFNFSSSTAFNMPAWKFPHLPSLQSMAGSNLQWKVVSFTSKYGKRRGKGAMKNRVGVTWCRVVGRIFPCWILRSCWKERIKSKKPPNVWNPGGSTVQPFSKWNSRWWQLKYFLFSPLFGEDIQFWPIFFKGVETTN